MRTSFAAHRVGFAPAKCSWDDLQAAKAAAPKATAAPTTPVPTPAPTHTPLAVACAVKPELQQLVPCNAVCPLGAAAASTVQGVELWGQAFVNATAAAAAAGGADTSKDAYAGCAVLKQEERPCSKNCTAGPVNPNGNANGNGNGQSGESTCATAWQGCTEQCVQTRQWPADAVSCSTEESITLCAVYCQCYSVLAAATECML